MKSVTFKFWVTLEFLRRHRNLKPKRFEFCIEYKPIDRTYPFYYQRLELFGLLEENAIKSSVAILKCFSIYYFKWKKSSSRIFILFLAALDLLNCVITLPTKIVMMRYSLIYNIPWLCKISRYATYFLNTASAAILVAIATDRYRRICKPWNNQFSAPVSKYICIGCIFFASLLTWPVLVFYGTRYVTLGRSIWTACLLENTFDSSSYPHIYFVLMMNLTILVFAIISVPYYFVGLKVDKDMLFIQRRCRQGIAPVKVLLKG